MKFYMTEHGFDTETEFGTLHISSNEEKGFRPYQLMVASIAVCGGGVMRKVLDKMRLPAEDIAIDVKEVVRSQDDASRLLKIHLHFTIIGSDVTEEKMPRVMMLTEKNCSMLQSVMGCIDVVKTYEIGTK
ncbi:osmotically inducible protein C [Sporosarcina sp. P21c]|uniref:OsmC family protein n=1 Tax=Sporosarcina TaxID=1569 RepID=UPI000A164456|nr:MULTISPECIES: OsmC family protein [Sporosarcina]ARJ38941.1 osmotically inducible protein C [Sporosarcina ureae]PIC68229.1 osmotically inducible protein C [Sporosarcina sp. P16a]PIC84053.1 osmotically inducible protein C [Sporosarcina sp. P1]PIC90440.1 osmotically inducible protein C [Sporosarcina sp. P21c]PIC93970.1 osmotically inducible protein C [Sporosarcina sp. P25]